VTGLLVVIASTLIGSGLAVGGDWGTALIATGFVLDVAWSVLAFGRWWRAASDKARGITVITAVVYLGGWFVIRVAAGPLAAWVLGFAAIGFIGTVLGVLATTGYFAAHHAKTIQHGIATGKIKEITR
jgi:hypothetical protein